MTSPTPHSPVILGIVGWKNSGKTTLVVSLVSALAARGFTVSTVKHAHHSFDVDQPGADTHRHRKAGAGEVAIISENRWALMHENAPGEKEPPLADILAKLSPCDIVLVEGYKAEAITKIEVQRAGAKSIEPLFKSQTGVIAVVNPQVETPPHLATFDADDIEPLCDFIIAHFALESAA